MTPEEPKPSPKPSTWSKAGLLSVAFLVGTAVALGLTFAPQLSRPKPAATLPMRKAMSTPFVLPGLRKPPALPAAKATVPDDAEVIGLSVGGRHRAYLVTAMSRLGSHVIDDLVDGVPVTVTFCDRSGCTRVFTDPETAEPLPVDLGGLQEDKMLLRFKNVFYDQESGERIDGVQGPAFPYPDHPFVRTTWKKWKEEHPDTDVFVGMPAPDAGKGP